MRENPISLQWYQYTGDTTGTSGKTQSNGDKLMKIRRLVAGYVRDFL